MLVMAIESGWENVAAPGIAVESPERRRLTWVRAEEAVRHEQTPHAATHVGAAVRTCNGKPEMAPKKQLSHVV